MNIKRILIANRGEIAVRIIRTCHELGIETVLAASAADLQSLAARLADQTICIGEGQSADSYLNIKAVIAAVRQCGADALHPGYGFLSENPGLPRACNEAGVTFIGPTADQLVAMGDKLQARQHAELAGLPVVPGGYIQDSAGILTLAEDIGWPILLKAVGGGGGRGMKAVSDPDQLAVTLDLAMAEADAAFGDSRIYVEKYLPTGRHVEVQLLGDGKSVIHLGTRDCSIQRRYQKLVEEAPAPELSETLRTAIHESAVKLGRHLQYRGLGTVEFLVDVESQAFFFLEMNARIQVEHPVTEMITGIDLVAEQIRVAENKPLNIDQVDVEFNGHAVECRINAEDPAQDFRPCPGTVEDVEFPAGAGIRVDTHVESGTIVSPFYDSLLAKLIVHDADRALAVGRMEKALELCRIDGVHTNLSMHRQIMLDNEFRQGGVDTTYFNRMINKNGFELN